MESKTNLDIDTLKSYARGIITLQEPSKKINPKSLGSSFTFYFPSRYGFSQVFHIKIRLQPPLKRIKNDHIISYEQHVIKLHNRKFYFVALTFIID